MESSDSESAANILTGLRSINSLETLLLRLSYEILRFSSPQWIYAWIEFWLDMHTLGHAIPAIIDTSKEPQDLFRDVLGEVEDDGESTLEVGVNGNGRNVWQYGQKIDFFDESKMVVIPIDKIQGRRVELGGVEYVFDEWIIVRNLI